MRTTYTTGIYVKIGVCRFWELLSQVDKEEFGLFLGIG